MAMGVFFEHDDSIEAQKAVGQGREPGENQAIEGAAIGNHEIPALDSDGVNESQKSFKGAVLVLANDVDVTYFLAVDATLAKSNTPIHPVSLIGAV